jgi:radical SAM superfamily enzyme YgiQ (UPF0313 family)
MPHPDPKTILLVHPLGRRPAKGGKDIARLANVMPPLGLASIAAWLGKRGFRAPILDCNARPDSDALLLSLLDEHRPAYVGFSCTTANFPDGARLARLVKTARPEIKTVFGGVHVSAQQEKALDFPELDCVALGEGEETLAEFMEREGRDLDGAPGLIWRDEQGLARRNPPRPPIPELDSLPFPDYEALVGFPQAYTLPLFNYPSAPNATAASSRGCPYACSYCDRSVFGRSFRANSADYLYEHLAFLKKRHGIRHVNFYDDQFTFDRARVERLCRMLRDKPLGLTFNCAVRPNHVDLELLRAMRAAGCWMVSLGVESGDQDLLTRHGRKLTVDATAQAVRLAKKARLRVKGLAMLGLPGETMETMLRTKEYLFSLPLDDFNLSKFTPFPGAPLYKEIRGQPELGEFDEDWERMDCMHFLFIPRGLDLQTLEDFFRNVYRDHYLRPKALWDRVSMLWRSPDSWRRFLKDLPSFLRFARSGKRYGQGEEA